MCCVQNNFYAYEHRDDFADALAVDLKNNKWLVPKSPEAPAHPETVPVETTTP